MVIVASSVQSVASKIKPGVASLRGGPGASFWLRRLHSLTGIVPIGLFLLEHFISNAEAFKGPVAYAKQVEFLNSLPFVLVLELFGIWIPILYHGLYGVFIWYRGDRQRRRISLERQLALHGAALDRHRGRSSTSSSTPTTCVSPGRASSRRIPGGVRQGAGRISESVDDCVLLHRHHRSVVAFFSYGVWLFAAKWGITTGEKRRDAVLATFAPCSRSD